MTKLANLLLLLSLVIWMLLIAKTSGNWWFRYVKSEMICASLELQILDKERSGFDFHSHEPQIAFHVG